MRLAHLLRRFRHPVQLGFLVATLAIAVMGSTLYEATQNARAAAHLVGQSEDLVHALADINVNLARVEAAERGYLLSGNELFVRERDAAAAKLVTTTATLHEISVTRPAQRTRVQELDALLADAAAYHSRSFVNPARLSLTALTAQMEQDEQILLGSRQIDERAGRERTLHVLVGTVVVSLLVLAPAYWGLARQSRRRMRVERQLTDLAENLPVTVYQFHTRAGGGPRFELVGSSVDKLFGVSQQAVLEDPLVLWNAVVYGDRLGFADAMKRSSHDLTPFEWEYRTKAGDGSLRWIRSCASLRREADGSILWNGYWADVTEQKRLARALEQAKEDADAASRAKSTFLATMSHEIRTPMNGVLGMLDLLGLSRLDGEQRSTLAIVRESGRGLLRIIDDILDFSKIEAGRLTLNPEPASITSVVERAVQIYSGVASSKGLLLTCRIDPRISPALHIDPLRLGQILNNLISNALKFTDRGSVQVSVERLASDAAADTLRLTVADSGIGIAPANQQRLFEPFVQAETSTARRFGGTGLGLSICRKLAALMGGAITMDSVLGKGTTVSLVLTLPHADPQALPQADPQSRQQQLQAKLATRRVAPSIERAEVDGTLVLVVDDHPTNRAVLMRQVTALGYAAESAEDGRIAFDMWKARRFAIIITDCNMPEVSGYDLARNIRRAEAARGESRIPIIACTANALGGEAQVCIDAGMDDYLAKPVELDELMHCLDRWRPVPQTRPALLDELEMPPGDDRALPAPVDRSLLAEISGSDADAERDILLDFRRVNDSDALMLRHAVSNADSPLVTRVSHRIKGASKMVGATGLATVCESIEAASRAANWAAIEKQMESFQLEMQELNEYLDAL